MIKSQLFLSRESLENHQKLQQMMGVNVISKSDRKLKLNKKRVFLSLKLNIEKQRPAAWNMCSVVLLLEKNHRGPKHHNLSLFL